MTGDTQISFCLCMAQLYFFLSFTGIEIFLLAAMAYDRYVAICNPLRYLLIMNRRACILLTSTSWILGFMNVISHTFLTSQLSFCRGNEIDHFFCELTVLMKLSCSDISNIEIILFSQGVFVSFIPFGLTLTSYLYIISNILKFNSAKGRHKAFSTCSSHLTTVTLFYGILIFVYLRPTSIHSPGQDKVFSLLYTALIPMLNPFIYSLRNEDVKRALLKCLPMNYSWTKSFDAFQFNIDMERFIRRFHLHIYFDKKEENYDRLRLCSKSSWIPPIPLDPIVRIFKEVVIRELLATCQIQQFVDNLSKDE
ncbi:olfactory receptor 1020-like [Microcaecilia unicolor]|uniref:Olfactory receptor 1020-like n=1 Tax=Microcaecilia unicolor TaxID=1415580 RepID=A0A6P7XJU7_9AMPH|nr:olfactory receptor 1020-like [Microcaecilia unicolor]